MSQQDQPRTHTHHTTHLGHELDLVTGVSLISGMGVTIGIWMAGDLAVVTGIWIISDMGVITGTRI